MHYVVYLFVCWASLLHSPWVKFEEDVVNSLKYDILRSGKVVGEMNAFMKKNNAGIEYTTESKITMSMLLSVDVYNKVSGYFVNGELQKGGIMRKVNGKIKANTQIIRNREKYIITDPDASTTLTTKIDYTTACLMYIEPLNTGQVFSEAFKQFLNIKKLSNHRYALQLPDGNENVYTYKDGHCAEVDIKSPVADLTIRLKK